MPRTARRPLTLHVSALSNAEYKSYTNSLAEITSPTRDVDWEDITLGVREARGWIRGRYGSAVDGSVIDQILRCFSPELGQHDVLTGGQFFAVLRLVCHAQSGAQVDDSLVFVQANPDPASPSREKDSSAPSSSRRPTSAKSAPPPPPRPSTELAANAATTTTPCLPLRTVPPIPSPNPFTRSQSSPHVSRTRPESQPPPAREKEHDTPGPVSSNPFRQSHSQHKASAPSVSSASDSSSSPSNPRQYAYASPPLPPRKPSSAALLPPPRHASLTATSTPKPRAAVPNSPNAPLSCTSSKPFSPVTPLPPPKPPKPPQATSPLIKQSLQAAKGANSIKEVMNGLSKERRWEVIKKSGGGANGGGGGGGGGGESSSGSGGGSLGGRSGEGTPHRAASPPYSFYDVASARIGRTASPESDSSEAEDLPEHAAPGPGIHGHQLAHTGTPNRLTPQFPFAHVVTPTTPTTPSSDASPTQNSFSSSPTQNPRRTKSLHHHSPASSSIPTSNDAPLPPPRRRRPESVQITSNGGSSPFGNANGIGIGGVAGDKSPFSDGHRRSESGPSSSPLSRHFSFSSSTPFQSASTSASPSTAHSHSGASNSVMDTLHRTIATLRPGPGFESARVRAEGRVWPSGYVKGLAGGEGEGAGARLVRDDDGGFGQDHGGMDDADGYDELRKMERDALKMPMRPDEGWTALT